MLLLGQPVGAEQPRGDLEQLVATSSSRLATRPSTARRARARRGRARRRGRASPRAARRGRRAPCARGSRGRRPGRRRSPPVAVLVHVLDDLRAPASRTRAITAARHVARARPCPCAASPTRRRASGRARRAGAPGRGSRRRAGSVLRIASPSSARHLPSLGRRAMFATITCVCRCGSCARDWCGAGRRPRRSPAACSRATPLRAAADDAGLVLEVGERRLPGGQVRLVDGAAGLLVAERVQQADALRRREDEVEAGDRRERLRPRGAARRSSGSIRSIVIVRAFGCRRRSSLAGLRVVAADQPRRARPPRRRPRARARRRRGRSRRRATRRGPRSSRRAPRRRSARSSPPGPASASRRSARRHSSTRPIYGSSASVSRLLSRLVVGRTVHHAVSLVVVEALPHCARSRRRGRARRASRRLARLSIGRGSTRSGRLACGELRALLAEPRGLLARQACSRRSRSASCSARCCLTEGGATRGRACRARGESASSCGS